MVRLPCTTPGLWVHCQCGTPRVLFIFDDPTDVPPVYFYHHNLYKGFASCRNLFQPVTTCAPRRSLASLARVWSAPCRRYAKYSRPSRPQWPTRTLRMRAERRLPSLLLAKAEQGQVQLVCVTAWCESTHSFHLDGSVAAGVSHFNKHRKLDFRPLNTFRLAVSCRSLAQLLCELCLNNPRTIAHFSLMCFCFCHVWFSLNAPWGSGLFSSAFAWWVADGSGVCVACSEINHDVVKRGQIPRSC